MISARRGMSMPNERLGSDAIRKISGAAWEPLRQVFLDMSDILLGVAPETIGVLTTIYVKFQVTATPGANVYAVAWMKNSKQLVIGLALKDDVESPLLGSAPVGMKYKGITKYFIIVPGQEVPEDFGAWAKAAYDNVSKATQ
jgi:hypothetical protein